MKKYVLAFVWAAVTFVFMAELSKWTGWGMELLIGWFPLTAWFATIRIMNGKNGVKYKVTPWGTVGIAFLVALSLSVILSAFNVHLIVNGALTGLVYNLMTRPDLQEEEIEK